MSILQILSLLGRLSLTTLVPVLAVEVEVILLDVLSVVALAVRFAPADI